MKKTTKCLAALAMLAVTQACAVDVTPEGDIPLDTLRDNSNDEDGDEPGDEEEGGYPCFCTALPRAFLTQVYPTPGRAAYVADVHARLANTPGKMLEQLFWARYGDGMWFTRCTQHVDTEDETSLVFLSAVHHGNQTPATVSSYYPGGHPAGHTALSHEPVAGRSDDQIAQEMSDNVEDHFCGHQDWPRIVPAWGPTL